MPKLDENITERSTIRQSLIKLLDFQDEEKLI